MFALLLFLGLVFATVMLGFLAVVQGGGRAVATTNAPRRLVGASRATSKQVPPDTLTSISRS